jgi:hypothetical protein
VTTLSQARTFALVLVLAVVTLGLLAVRSARQAAAVSTGSSAAVTPVASPSTPGSGAVMRHGYRIALGR